MNKLPFVAAGALACLAGCTLPAPDPNTQLRGNWVFQTYDGPQDLTNVKGGDWILKQPLMPPGAARLTEDFQYKDDIIEAGSLLARSVRGGTHPVYCSIEPLRHKSGLEKMLWVKTESHVCLEDTDDDNVFDQYNIVQFQYDALPLVNTVVKNPKPAMAAYETVDPSEVGKKYYAGLKFTGHGLIGHQLNFRIYYGSDDDTDSLDNVIQINSQKLPGSYGLNGARFTVTEDGDDGISVHIDTPFPAHSIFGIITQTVYRTVYY